MSFLSITYLLFLTLSLVFITKNTFGKCLLFGIFISAFTLYFSQMFFKTFNYGFYLLIIFSFFIISVEKYKYDKKMKMIINSFIVPTLFILITSILD